MCLLCSNVFSNKEIKERITFFFLELKCDNIKARKNYGSKRIKK